MKSGAVGGGGCKSGAGKARTGIVAPRRVSRGVRGCIVGFISVRELV